MDLIVKGPHGPQQGYVYTGGKAFDAALPALVLVHGALHDHSVWTLLARWFAHHGHAVLAPDLPGHGRSAGPALESVEALADWVLGLMDGAGVAKAALAGHSMGALVALEAASRAPERATRLVMLGTAYPMTVSPVLLETARDAPLRAIDLVNGYSHSGFAAKPSYPGPGSSLHGGNRALMRRMQAGPRDDNLFLRDFQVCDRYAGGLEAAVRIECRSHLILGRHDQMALPKQAGALASALGAEVATVQAGHAMMSEDPDGVLSALRKALG